MQTDHPDILARLDRLELCVGEVRDLLVAQRDVKDWYTTAEIAKILGKAEFTVREYCRLGRVRAEKRPCGRGKSQEWIISHDELTRLLNEGLLPLRKH
jgi:Helix-turn-helix domain